MLNETFLQYGEFWPFVRTTFPNPGSKVAPGSLTQNPLK
jgi:hypothetical protein